jgi:tRNA (adenine57-N1/adenine58-N1)-methyltransferase
VSDKVLRKRVRIAEHGAELAGARDQAEAGDGSVPDDAARAPEPGDPTA